MKKLGLLLLLFSILCSCKKSLKDKIIAKFDEKCKGDSVCKIDLKELADFKWDKFYLFQDGVGLETINKELGFHYPYFEDMATRIIFTLGDRVAYHEDEFPDISDTFIPGLIFNIYKIDTPYWSCDSKNAVFRVKKKNDEGFIYYELTLIKEQEKGELTPFVYR